jgi:hypothetical protein
VLEAILAAQDHIQAPETIAAVSQEVIHPVVHQTAEVLVVVLVIHPVHHPVPLHARVPVVPQALEGDKEVKLFCL